jgi:extensin-like protein
MSRGVSWLLFGSLTVAALVALAGCSGHNFYSGEREAWRRDAEVACLNSGAVRETPQRVRISAISGPGICGADYPLRVSALGDTTPLGYDDESLRPPSSIPAGAMPQTWPGAQAPSAQQSPYPQQSQSGPPSYPPAYPQQSPYTQRSSPQSPYGQQPTYAAAPSAPQAGPPMSLYPPGVSQSDLPPPYPAPVAGAGGVNNLPPAPPHPYPGAANAGYGQPPPSYPPAYPPDGEAPPMGEPQGLPPAPALPPLGPERGPGVTAAIGPVGVHPAATLACPLVSALDQWISMAVQPAALKWFRVPVVEIKQISAYSCRGMNGNPNAHISEHAFGNALDIAEFSLADGRRISVQYGWHGSPEEQGFLRDVQAAACAEFSTVLAPGANVYHYNHIHVDLMRRASGRHICEPGTIPGEVVAERARAQYAAQHYGEAGVTGSIKDRTRSHALSYSGDDDDRLPLAVPGDD